MAKYEEQWERVERSYNRFKAITEGQPDTSQSKEYDDVPRGFFNECHNLKDHLKNDPGYQKHTPKEIEDYVTNTPALAICADISNSAKHLVLDRAPRSGGNTKFPSGRNITLRVMDDLTSTEQSTPEIAITYFVEVDSGTYRNAFQVATEALKAWQRFIF